MFDSPYAFCSLGKSDTHLSDPYKKIYYKFYAKHRTYLVTLEFYSFQLVAIKYCDVKDKNNPRAYHKIFNDGDAPRVIGTCFYIMLQFWRKNRNVNFVFYASLRDMSNEVIERKVIDPIKLPDFIASFKRSRYSIYRYGMLNLFSYEHFTQYSDRENCIYVLMNKNEKAPDQVIDQLKSFLAQHHNVLFEPS